MGDSHALQFPEVKSPFTKGRWVTAINDYTF